MTNTTADQLGDTIRSAINAQAESSYRRGAFGYGSEVFPADEVHAGAKESNRLTVAMWRTFYDYAGQVGDATSRLHEIADKLAERDADDQLDPTRMFELLNEVCELLPGRSGMAEAVGSFSGLGSVEL